MGRAKDNISLNILVLIGFTESQFLPLGSRTQPIHFPSCLGLARFPYTLLILMSYSTCLAKNTEPKAAVPSICKVTASIKGTADKQSHIAISENAVLFLLLFISAVVIAVPSLGPVSGSQINVLAGSQWVQPRPLMLTKVAYFEQGRVRW